MHLQDLWTEIMMMLDVTTTQLWMESNGEYFLKNFSSSVLSLNDYIANCKVLMCLSLLSFKNFVRNIQMDQRKIDSLGL